MIWLVPPNQQAQLELDACVRVCHQLEADGLGSPLLPRWSGLSRLVSRPRVGHAVPVF
jgi:hypothetical protein